MKIGIIGPADRAIAWEEHLGTHPSVSEVIISATLQGVEEIDACFLLSDEDDNLRGLLEAAKKGYHTFWVAPLPTDTRQVKDIYHVAEESNVLLQFSHWPTLAPASKWMSKKIPKPGFLQINREFNYTQYLEADHNFDYYWVDELAFCLRWVDGAVHHIDLNTVEFPTDKTYALHLFLRFDNGATANIYVNAASAATNHHRIAADKNYIADYNVAEQTVRLGEQNENEHLYFKRQSFDSSKAAELAASAFIKSIQLNRPSIYNGYHLLELSKTMDKIRNRLERM